MNLLEEELKQYDSFYFSAEERHSSDREQLEQKIRLYQFMADRLSKRTGKIFMKEVV